MTAAALHELTEIRRRAVQARAAALVHFQYLDDLVTVVSRMEDAALTAEGLFSAPYLTEQQEQEARGEDHAERERAGL